MTATTTRARIGASAALLSVAHAGRGLHLRRRPDPGQPDRATPVDRDAVEPNRATCPIPSAIELPRDDGPHDRLTEWWYYTGHLRAADGARFGFEYVVFRAERGAFPTSWVSHLAVTDESGGRFLYGQRLETGPQVDRSPTRRRRHADRLRSRARTGSGDAPTAGPAAWSMAGGGGTDHLAATLTPDEAARAGSRGASGWISGCARRSRRRSTATTAGSTSGRPAARTTTRGRR